MQLPFVLWDGSHGFFFLKSLNGVWALVKFFYEVCFFSGSFYIHKVLCYRYVDNAVVNFSYRTIGFLRGRPEDVPSAVGSNRGNMHGIFLGDLSHILY